MCSIFAAKRRVVVFFMLVNSAQFFSLGVFVGKNEKHEIHTLETLGPIQSSNTRLLTQQQKEKSPSSRLLSVCEFPLGHGSMESHFGGWNKVDLPTKSYGNLRGP